MGESSRGFSLIEVLIAAFVLAVAVTASAALFSFSITTNTGNRDRAIAITLLQDKMEELRQQTPLPPGTYSELVQPAAHSSHRFLRAWRIDPGLPRRITVTISKQRHSGHGPYDEMARASTLVAPGF